MFRAFFMLAVHLYCTNILRSENISTASVQKKKNETNIQQSFTNDW